ncbi:50S ribosomal protein L10 [Sediminispirochaeta bajacaliforniensis]|uniref:50S ribosomal protein L10 n=1 Tax=Sediminispirochaeta bajacaliforniensis TaxID=148 RepID=UPI00036FFF0B|nr:50S ribosomal protein L10 [Sediminispirochaeta bajacaliforniensis]
MAEYQTKIQDYKVEAVDSLKSEFEGVQDYIFTNYRGLTVAQITELRDKLRKENALFKVVKNRFAKIALRDMEQPAVDEHLTGPTAVALAKGESGPVAKILFEIAKELPLEVKGGIINGNVFDAGQVEAFSKLPTRHELIAMLMGTMRAPVQNVVYVLNAVPTKLVRTLQAVADKKQAG